MGRKVFDGNEQVNTVGTIKYLSLCSFLDLFITLHEIPSVERRGQKKKKGKNKSCSIRS